MFYHFEERSPDPFSLIQILVTDESGKQMWRPMWLSVFGQCRQQCKAEESWQAYRQRYDLEHFLRFGKQKLLMTAFQLKLLVCDIQLSKKEQQ